MNASTIKTRIKSDIENLDMQALALVYQQIKILRDRQLSPSSTEISKSEIDRVLDLTSSSKNSWSDSIIADREERV